MNQWIDITHTLSEQFPAWPGEPQCKIQTKVVNTCISSTISCSLHSGTHIDAPLHFIAGGDMVCDIPLNKLIGKVQIISVGGPYVEIHHLDNLTCSKVLFKTYNRISPRFTTDYCYISPEAAREIARRNIELVGVDYLSVEQFGNDKFSTHIALLKTKIVIIESLDLSNISEGYYYLVALPMKVRGEAAPARVIVRPWNKA